ncbi:Hsp20/alpha crystallin family protein [Candidatus Bathyarchaeota archaeon]|nr:Hsp20/alpha crystallin family protein [Candidatus Bathyarchaeota archaeon]
MKRKIRFYDFGITYYKCEFRTLHCQTRIPVPGHTDRMEARFKKGNLEIHLPRKLEYEIPIGYTRSISTCFETSSQIRLLFLNHRL